MAYQDMVEYWRQEVKAGRKTPDDISEIYHVPLDQLQRILSGDPWEIHEHHGKPAPTDLTDVEDSGENEEELVTEYRDQVPDVIRHLNQVKEEILDKVRRATSAINARIDRLEADSNPMKIRTEVERCVDKKIEAHVSDFHIPPDEEDEDEDVAWFSPDEDGL